MWLNTRSSRSAVLSISSSSCFSEIFRPRWLATVSASLEGSSIWLTETSTSGAIFLFSLMYCSNCATTGAAQRFHFLAVVAAFFDGLGDDLEIILGLLEAGDAGAPDALDQHLHGAVRQFQQLQNGGDSPHAVDVLGRWIVLRRVLLRHEQDLLVVLHHAFQRAHGFLSPDEKRHDHVREDHDVAQRQHRQRFHRQISFCYIRHYQIP